VCAYKPDSKESETTEDRFFASSRLRGTEAIVVGLFKVVLECPHLSLDENLIEIGITPVQVMALITHINRTFDKQLPDSAIYEHPTARSMAAWLQMTSNPTPASVTVLPQVHGEPELSDKQSGKNEWNGE
jgi:aryl carrier-like protein